MSAADEHMAAAVRVLADTFRAEGRVAIAEVFDLGADRLEPQPELPP